MDSFIEELPNEEEIVANLLSFSGDIYDQKDVLRFLTIHDLEKPNSCRFLCWICCLKIIPFERVKWITGINRVIEYYQRCLKRHFSDCFEEPLNGLFDAQGPLIRSRVELNEEWFISLAKNCNIPVTRLVDNQVRLQRMIANMALEFPSYVFSKFDEYIFMVAYVVCLGFVSRGSLPNTFAEAFAFRIAQQVLSINTFNKKLNMLSASSDYDSDYIKHLKKNVPKIHEYCLKRAIDPCDILHILQDTFFCSLHKNNELLLIWDILIANLDCFREYSGFITIAHLIEIRREGGRIEEDSLIPDQNWNLIRILDNTFEMYSSKDKDDFKNMLSMICPCYEGLKLLFRW